MRQRNAVGGIGPDAARIGTPIGNGVSHRSRAACNLVAAVNEDAIEKPGDTAHTRCSDWTETTEDFGEIHQVIPVMARMRR